MWIEKEPIWIYALVYLNRKKKLATTIQEAFVLSIPYLLYNVGADCVSVSLPFTSSAASDLVKL